MTCFMLLVMGLGPRFCVFSCLGSPLCVLHFRVWAFVWTTVLFFFFSCVFSVLYLFLISAKGGTCKYKEKLGQCFPCCTRFDRNLEEKKTSAEREGPKKVPERERERGGDRQNPSIRFKSNRPSVHIHP